VNLQAGRFDLLFKSHQTLTGKVTGGTVQWPESQSDTSLGCGTYVGRVTVFLTINGHPHTFDGCLHDLPVGTVIPPKIWGTLH
jgi:hypothetical protein